MACAPSPVGGSGGNNARHSVDEGLPTSEDEIRKAVAELPPEQRQAYIDKLKEAGITVPDDVQAMAPNGGDIK